MMMRAAVACLRYDPRTNVPVSKGKKCVSRAMLGVAERACFDAEHTSLSPKARLSGGAFKARLLVVAHILRRLAVFGRGDLIPDELQDPMLARSLYA
jgi:hypothetical protein